MHFKTILLVAFCGALAWGGYEVSNLRAGMRATPFSEVLAAAGAEGKKTPSVHERREALLARLFGARGEFVGSTHDAELHQGMTSLATDTDASTVTGDFEVAGKAGETIVVEVDARRLGSPFDSFVKVTGADGRVINLSSAAQSPVDLDALAGERCRRRDPPYLKSRVTESPSSPSDRCGDFMGTSSRWSTPSSITRLTVGFTRPKSNTMPCSSSPPSS